MNISLSQSNLARLVSCCKRPMTRSRSQESLFTVWQYYFRRCLPQATHNHFNPDPRFWQCSRHVWIIWLQSPACSRGYNSCLKCFVRGFIAADSRNHLTIKRIRLSYFLQSGPNSDRCLTGSFVAILLAVSITLFKVSWCCVQSRTEKPTRTESSNTCVRARIFCICFRYLVT
jgi:hypothetical protein